MAPLSLAMTSFGVALGAKKPNHPAMCHPGTPPSSDVGMSGIEGERSGDKFAIALIVAPRTCGSAAALCTTIRSTWPETRSVMAGPAPRYGMNVTFVSVSCCSRIPLTCAAAS